MNQNIGSFSAAKRNYMFEANHDYYQSEVIVSMQCFPRVPTAGQNGQLLGFYWPTTFVEDIKSCYPEVKASKLDKGL